MSEFTKPTHRPSKKTKIGQGLTIADVLADKNLAQHSAAFRDRIEREAALRETSLNEAPVLPDQMGNEGAEYDSDNPVVKETAPSDHVGVRIVNGEIVIDESTLTYHQADVDRLRNLQVEHEFGNTNNGRKKKTARSVWSKIDIEEFFLNLQKYGTDFDLISQVMTKFTRKQILNRFRLEEKKNGKRIDYCLSHSLPFDESDFHVVHSESSEED